MAAASGVYRRQVKLGLSVPFESQFFRNLGAMDAGKQ